MTSRNSLQWRLQKGGLLIWMCMLMYFILGLLTKRVLLLQKLQENSLVYEQDSCGNFRGDINVRNSEISRHPYIDGLLANSLLITEHNPS